jgi:hypothetical protein
MMDLGLFLIGASWIGVSYWVGRHFGRKRGHADGVAAGRLEQASELAAMIRAQGGVAIVVLQDEETVRVEALN